MSVLLFFLTTFILWLISFAPFKRPFINKLSIATFFHLIIIFTQIPNPVNSNNIVPVKSDSLAYKSFSKNSKKNNINHNPKLKQHYQNNSPYSKLKQFIFINNPNNNQNLLSQNYSPTPPSYSKNPAKQHLKNHFNKKKLSTITNINPQKSNNITTQNKNQHMKNNFDNDLNNHKNNQKHLQKLDKTNSKILSLTDLWLQKRRHLKKYIYQAPSPLYLKNPNEWQDFSFDLSLNGSDSKYSVQGFDEFTHKDYMQYILETVGHRWFYQYAPIQLIANNIMHISTPISVVFTLHNSGKIKDFRFLDKGSVEMQFIAVQKTFNSISFKKVPSRVSYKDLHMIFTIFPPSLTKPDEILIKGEIKIRGKVKIK